MSSCESYGRRSRNRNGSSNRNRKRNLRKYVSGSIDQSMSSCESSGSLFQQICVIADHVGSYDDNSAIETGYAVFIIDVSTTSNFHNNNNELLNPIVKVVEDVVGIPAVAVLRDKLYAFGGFIRGGGGWVKEVRSYDLKDAYHSPTPLILPIRSMAKVREMNATKWMPKAVVIDETRICVFSTHLYDHRWRTTNKFAIPNFELFNTRTNAWQKLPEPFSYASLCGLYGGHAEIHSYCTQDLSLIITTNIGVYRMNFRNPVYEWEYYDEFEYIPQIIAPGVCIIGDVLLSPHTAAKLSKTECDEYRLLLKAEREKPIPESGNSGLFIKGGHVFIVRIGFYAANRVMPTVFVQIIKYDDLLSHVFKKEQIEAVKSFCFSLNNLRCETILIAGCSPVKIHGWGTERSQGRTEESSLGDGAEVAATTEHRLGILIGELMI